MDPEPSMKFVMVSAGSIPRGLSTDGTVFTGPGLIAKVTLIKTRLPRPAYTTIFQRFERSRPVGKSKKTKTNVKKPGMASHKVIHAAAGPNGRDPGLLSSA